MSLDLRVAVKVCVGRREWSFHMPRVRYRTVVTSGPRALGEPLRVSLRLTGRDLHLFRLAAWCVRLALLPVAAVARLVRIPVAVEIGSAP